MNIHEYQAKDLFRQYGVRTLEGVVASNPEEAARACKNLGEIFGLLKLKSMRVVEEKVEVLFYVDLLTRFMKQQVI